MRSTFDAGPLRGTHLALEAIPMPLGIQRHNRVLRYRLTAAGAARREQLLEVDATVGSSVSLIERCAHQWRLAWTGAHEALLMPRLLHGLDGALPTKKNFILIHISKISNKHYNQH